MPKSKPSDVKQRTLGKPTPTGWAHIKRTFPLHDSYHFITHGVSLCNLFLHRGEVTDILPSQFWTSLCPSCREVFEKRKSEFKAYGGPA